MGFFDGFGIERGYPNLRTAWNKGEKYHIQNKELKFLTQRKYLGKNNPNWRGGYKKRCEFCNEDFWIIPSTSNKRRFCSVECKGKWWSKELLKRGDYPHYIEHPSGMLGRHHKEETRELISKRLKGKKPHDKYGSVSKAMKDYNPMYNIEVRKLHKEGMNEWAKQRKIKELPFGGWPKEKPNKEEKELLQFLNEVIPNEYEYVGDGKVWINGLNPDFICRGKRKLN